MQETRTEVIQEQIQLDREGYLLGIVQEIESSLY